VRGQGELTAEDKQAIAAHKPALMALLRAEAEEEARPCRRCGSTVKRCYWFHFRDGRKQIKLECGTCSTPVKFLAQTPENIARADAGTNPTAALDLLMLLEERGIRAFVDVHGELHFEPERLPEDLRLLERQCRGLLVSMLSKSRPVAAERNEHANGTKR
jgi:hypothetical protein